MDTKKQIAQLDDEHLAFRRKSSWNGIITI